MNTSTFAAATVRAIPCASIVAYNQIRTMSGMDAQSLADLAGSLKTHGMLQPILVRAEGDSFALVSGHRRMAAAAIAGFDHVPAIVIATDDHNSMEVQLAENLQRENLNLSETAAAVRILADMNGGAAGVTKVVNKSKAWISKHLALTSPRLTPEVRGMLDNGQSQDLELLLAMDQIAKHADGKPVFTRLANRLANGALTRAEARDALTKLKADPSEVDPDAGEEEDDEGGALENPKKSVVCQIKLTAELMDKFTELGGETWLRKIIRKELKAAA